MKSLLIALVAIIFSITSSNAQAQKKPSLEILVEELSESASKCGITKDGLRAPTVLILRQNRIDVGNDTFPYLYIVLNIIYAEGLCGFEMGVSIRDSQVASNRNGFRSSKNETVLLCDKSTTGMVGVNMAPQSITGVLEKNVKHCLANVTY